MGLFTLIAAVFIDSGFFFAHLFSSNVESIKEDLPNDGIGLVEFFDMERTVSELDK